MSETYFPYHLHSDYSLLDSATRVPEYVDYAAENGYAAISFSEHGKPLNWVTKKILAEEKGLKFVHSCEVYLTESIEREPVRDNYHTVLIAKNFDGVRELNKLITLSSQPDHFYYTNRLTFDEFLNISDNIISTSACVASPLNRLPPDHPMFMALARKYDYLEIQPHVHPKQKEFNLRLFRLSREIGKPLIVGTDTHSLNQYKADCRAVIMDCKGQSYDDDEFDLTWKSRDEVLDMFDKQGVLPYDVYAEALENTNRMCGMIEPFELDTSIKYPILYGSPEKDMEVFAETVERKFAEKIKKGIIPEEQVPAFRNAIDEEMAVFKKLGMGAFMLSMSELISWCKGSDIAIGTARGSVGGSRVAYVADIIDLNPETWHTVFSRFANEDRVEIGDIDIDCIESDRPKIFDHIIERFGADKTARVAAFGTLQEKAVIDDVGKALRVRYEKENEGKDNPYALAKIDEIKKEFDSDPDAAKKKYPEIFYYMDGLIGVKISQSVHPAGMVISPVTLDDNYGTFLKDGERCLVLDMDSAHEANLCKYDFLVLKTVQLIRDTCAYLGQKYPLTHEMDWNDAKVWEDFDSDPTSVFQYESKFAADAVKKFKPKNVFEASLVTAAIRPSGASYRDDLLARKPHHNPSKAIDEVLEISNHYLTYQESIIQFLQQICGFSGSQADTIRRGIAKKKQDVLEAAMPQILEGYCAHSDKPREVAEQEAKEFIQIVQDSSSYMFGYNHSIAYTLLGYMSAYYKYHHPLEYITAYLNTAANDDDIETGTYLANKYKIRITEPRFGKARGDYFFDRESNTISKGVGSIKGLSKTVADELYELSQKKSYDYFIDLLTDIAAETSCNSGQTDTLIKAEYFRNFGNQRELQRIVQIFERFKRGAAKQIKKEDVAGTELEPVMIEYASGVMKSGDVSKNWHSFDCAEVMRECERRIRAANLPDLDDRTKLQNYIDAVGYPYASGVEADRNKLYVTQTFPAKRKSDGEVFGYNIRYQSIGSGKTGSMTVFNKQYKQDPIRPGDLIRCLDYTRKGKYFNLNSYEHIY